MSPIEKLVNWDEVKTSLEKKAGGVRRQARDTILYVWLAMWLAESISIGSLTRTFYGVVISYHFTNMDFLHGFTQISTLNVQ